MKELIPKILMGLAILGLSACVTFAKSTREIMLEVKEVAVNSSKSTIQKVKLETCAYMQRGKKSNCINKPVVKILEYLQKDTGNGIGKSVSFVLEPEFERGVGILTYDYEDPAKDADNYVYLPALGKVKRIITGSNDDGVVSGSFFGSEFSVADLENQKIDDYSYKLLRKDRLDNQPVWIIEAIPSTKRTFLNGYSRIVSWIDQNRYIVLKVEMYNRFGRLYKRLTMGILLIIY